MPRKSAVFLTSALFGAALVLNPLAAEAGGMTRIDTKAGGRALRAIRTCGGLVPAVGLVTQGANQTPSVFGPKTNINNPVNVQTNIDTFKTIEIYKPITITKSIDASKTIDINKNVDININNVTLNDNSVSNTYSTGYAAAYAEATGYGGGDFAVNAAPGMEALAKLGQCRTTDATLVKAIHPVCVSADGREFPASHMVGDTWIDSGYEGEVARCLPGSTLKVRIASVVQSDQGLATALSKGQTLSCGPRQAVRHYKNGQLKCAPAVPVADCTERTNLRKWGTGDMFFSYVAKLCIPDDMTGGASRESAAETAQPTRQAYLQSDRPFYGSADKAIDQRSLNMSRGK
jgi:hypothetical protein